MMKRLIIYYCRTGILMILFFLLLDACTEIPPYIVTEVKLLSTFIDTTYLGSDVPTVQNKHVLLEDLTGVRCINCPKADTLGKKIQEIYPEKVIIVQLHSDIDEQFTTPFEKGDTAYLYDLRTSEAGLIEKNMLGQDAKPNGAIDRIIFSGQTKRTNSINTWQSYIKERLLLNTPVNIEIETFWEESERKINVKVKITYTSSITDDHYLSVSLLEDNVKAAQLTPDLITFPPEGVNPDYIHNHVLRKMATPYNGELITADNITTREKGRVYIKAYAFKLESFWKASDCKIVAFVHLSQADKFDVLHVVEVDGVND